VAKKPEIPKRLSQKKAKRLLEAHGWTEERGGKHVVKMTKPGHRPITLPICDGEDYGPSLTARIVTQAGLKATPATTESENDNTGTEGE